MKQSTISVPQAPKVERVILEGISAILLILWIYVGLGKFFDYKSFSTQMFQSAIFKNYAQTVAIGIPALELCIALLLIIKKTKIIGFYLSFFLMLMFTIYVGYLMIFVPNLPCSCGGIISSISWPQHLALNIILTVLAFVAIILQRRYIKNNKASSLHSTL